MQTHFLEKTTNTHKLRATNIKVLKEIGSTQVLEIEGDGEVTHGEHGVQVTESKHVIKYVQREVNPITKKIEEAFD